MKGGTSAAAAVFVAAIFGAVTLQAQTRVAIDADDIGGVVSGPNGPEAGVWVIAETNDLPTRYSKSVVTDDLVAALNNGTIAGAGLDVTEPEPLPRDHALWKAKNIIITPHMSAQSDLGQGVRAMIFREQVRRFAAGDKLLSVVDPQKGY